NRQAVYRPLLGRRNSERGHDSMTRIFDCFLYMNEVECLEMRLAELGGVVDGFVMVESETTFSGKPKPIRGPIPGICHVQYGMPSSQDPWDRERHQRNAIMDGLNRLGAEDGDIATVCDADEIVSEEGIRALIDKKLPVVFQARFTYYYVNAINHERQLSPMAATVGWLRSHSPDQLRVIRHSIPVAPEVAWHMSFLGGPDRILKKIDCNSHQELNNQSREHIDRCLKDGVAFHTGQKL